MTSDVKIVLDHSAIADLLRSPQVQAYLGARARRIAAAAGPGMEVEVSIRAKDHRARASVRTATFAARKAEATTRALLRALDAGR